MRTIILFTCAVVLVGVGVKPADAQRGEKGRELAGELLTAESVLADSAEHSCQALHQSLWSPDLHQVGHCRAKACSAAGSALRYDWVACDYERRFVLPASDSDPTDTVAENDVVLYRTESMLPSADRVQPKERRFLPVWREGYEPETLTSVTPSVTPVRNGAMLLAIQECLNGTGGCNESFALYRRGSWRALRLAFLDSLERRYPGAVRHGFHVNPSTLTADIGIYSDGDSNCCPSRSAVVQLRIRADALEIKAIRITPVSREQE